MAGQTIDRDRTPLSRLRRAVPGWRAIGLLAVVLNVQIVFVLAHLIVGDVNVSQPRYILYGMVWLNVGAAVLYAVRPPRGVDFRTRRRAIAIAATYFALLAFFTGMIGVGVPEHATDLRIAWLLPGWGPALVVATEYLTVVLMPAYIVGYVALSYLIYVTILDASGSAIAGVLGLFSCVSCSLPIVTMVLSAFVGGSSVLATTALDVSYELSTIVFLMTVALLYWRPGFR